MDTNSSDSERVDDKGSGSDSGRKIDLKKLLRSKIWRMRRTKRVKEESSSSDSSLGSDKEARGQPKKRRLVLNNDELEPEKEEVVSDSDISSNEDKPNAKHDEQPEEGSEIDLASTTGESESTGAKDLSPDSKMARRSVLYSTDDTETGSSNSSTISPLVYELIAENRHLVRRLRQYERRFDQNLGFMSD